MNSQYRHSFLEAAIGNANTGIPLAHLLKSGRVSAGTKKSHIGSHITSPSTPRSWLITKIWKKHILPQINRRNSIVLFVLICVGVGPYAWRAFNASFMSHFSLQPAVSKLIESYVPTMSDIGFNVPEVPRYYFEHCRIVGNVFDDTGNY